MTDRASPFPWFVLSATLVGTACSSAVTTSDGSTEGGNIDAIATESGCTGRAPTDCASGVSGGACGDTVQTRVCSGSTFVCPAGTIPIAQCACVGPGPSGCVCGPRGWTCSDGGDVPVIRDVPVVRDAVADAGCTDCVSATVSWGMDGGFVAYSERSTVATCRTFTFERNSFGGPPSRMCSNELPPCGAGDTPNVGDLEAALADPDVVRALASAPVLYGRDSRPVDGQVFQIVVGGRRIEIGDDCRPGDPSCPSVPPGVARLRDFLERLTRERLRFGSCATTFPDAG